jgi:iron(III) transport system ATP-binding protein
MAGIRFAAILSLLCIGCSSSSEPTLSYSSIDRWVVPADGARIPAPRGLFSDEDDTVYVLDDAGRVLIYSSDGKVQKSWHMPEYSAGRPEGIVRLNDGRIAVADTHYHRVVLFDGDGEVNSMFGDYGSEYGQFVYPVAITEDPEGFLYVGEYGEQQRIQKFSADGTFILSFGEHGTGDGQFQRPSGIAWSEGKVYAVDAFNERIQLFSDEGQFLEVINLPDNVAGFEYPYDIRVMGDELYVIENKAARLTVLKTDGSLIGRFGNPGRDTGDFFGPWSLTLLTDGRVLIADTGNHRIVELTP